VTVRKATLALCGAAALAAAPALAAAAAPKKRTVLVTDNYYNPKKLTIHVGDTLRWHWDENETDVHDVKLAVAPKGVPKFQTEPLAAGQSYSRKLTKPGSYRFICTFHEDEMFMSVTVKKR
jgi:plastocyanin